MALLNRRHLTWLLSPVSFGCAISTGSDGDFWGDPGSNLCRTETYTIAPVVDCSAEVRAQIDEDRAVVDGYANAGAVAPAEELVAHASCDAGVQSTREALKKAYDYQIRTQRLSALTAQCDPQIGYRTVGNCRSAGYPNAGAGTGGSATGGPVVIVDDAQDGATSYSTTNNQVAGVDEADFIKNDAEFVYTITTPAAGYAPDGTPYAGQGAGAELVIADVWPAEQAAEVSRILLEGMPKKLHLEGDQLLVYASIPRAPQSAPAYPNYYYGGYYGGGGDCTYGYDCVPTGDGMGTLISIYDVSDRSTPKLTRRLELSGSYINSRRINSFVYTVVHDPARSLPGLSTVPTGTGGAPEALIESYKKVASDNEAKIDMATPEELLPEMYVKEVETAQKQAVECGDVYEAPGMPGTGFLSVLALDLADDAIVRRATVISQPGFTYASAEALYVAVPHSAYPSSSGSPAEQASVVHKFQLSGLTTQYAASGSVEGRVLNQFAMDEYAGDLRIATTTGHAPDPATHSALSVLAPDGARLVTVGKVDDIAPTEDIRSVRFAADRGYVVTFKKTDPLYVFDLADRTAPRIAGELKIPGFSTYMHPLDAGHILSIGYDADDQGDFAWFAGIQLQIFDVTDMSNPTLIHKQLIGTRGSSSEALTDHLAFTYFAPKKWLALPLTICEGGSGGSYADQMTFSGLYLYDVGIDTGFSLVGSVAHPPTGGYEAYAGATCSNWWTDASSQVKRSIVMDDYVLSVSEREIKLNHSANLSADVATVLLQQAL